MSSHNLSAVLNRNFDLELPETIGREKILEALSMRIAEMLAGAPDQLFSLLYRLDIAEKDLKQVLKESLQPDRSIAELVYKRQLEKMQSRQQFRSDRPDDELSW